MIQSFAPFFFMVAEILAAEFVFALPLRRRSYFWARFIGSAVICIAATLWIAGIYSLVTDTEMTYGSTDRLGDSIFKIVYYLFVFGLTVAGIKFSYNASIWTVLFYCSGGYAAQHMAVNIARLFRLIPVFSVSLGGYLLEVGICAAIYTLSYFLFIRRENVENNDRDVRKKVFLSLCILSICIGISRLTTDDPTRSVLTCIAEAISAIVNCVLILSVLFDVTAKNKAERELEIMTELLHREKEQYRLTKENIDLINIKCHDLKHQIKALRENASEPYIRKIEDAVMFYDAAFKTGNDVLDVILTEKSLFCEQNKICFTCVARGEDLSFMEDMDVYSLFGNALSNAIERVRTIEDENRRCISVNVQTTGRLLSVHIENFYEGEIVFKNGFPVTDRNRDHHGFGMKSMDYIAKRYNGCMSISAQDGLFGLDFIFPLPETDETDKADKMPETGETPEILPKKPETIAETPEREER